MSSKKTSKLLRSMRTPRQKSANNSFTGALVLPNNSGDHVKGYKRQVPALDYDIVNKKYVDDQIAGVGTPAHADTTGQTTDDHHTEVHTHTLDEIDNPAGDTTFNFAANKHLHFRWTGDWTGDDGAFEIEALGAFTGDLVHIHQHTGNPGAADLVHLEAEDADVVPLRVTGVGTYDIISGNIQVAGIDIGTDVAANTAARHSNATDHGVNDPNTSSAPALGADDNYVTDAEKIVIGNTSGTNTGDQNSHDALDDVSADDHHSKQHAINDAANHTSPLDPGQMIMANVITGLPNNATNTNVEVAGAVNHSTGDGSDHADVATNSTHTAGDGSDHADVATNTAASHAQAHTVASHSDTTATGTELDSLTDDSIVDTKHRHSELSALGGSKALSLDGNGIMSMTLQSRAGAYRTTTQSINTATLTTVVFPTQMYDAQNEYNVSTGVFTAITAGYYSASWGILMDNVNWDLNEYMYSAVSKNNAATASNLFVGIRWYAQVAHTSSRPSSVGSAIIYLAASDTLRVKVYHTQGAAVNVDAGGTYNYFMVHKLS